MKKPPGKQILFVAALAPMGNCFTLNSDGEARLTVVVSAEAAEPLAKAMADGWMRDATFIVTIQKPE